MVSKAVKNANIIPSLFRRFTSVIFIAFADLTRKITDILKKKIVNAQQSYRNFNFNIAGQSDNGAFI